jgi:hypothetical protein
MSVRISLSYCTQNFYKRLKIKIPIGEEGPKYYINSHAGVPRNQGPVPGAIDYDACLFGENMNVNHQNIDISPLLVNEKCIFSLD